MRKTIKSWEQERQSMKVNESNEYELVTADSQGTERAPWKEELLQALQNLFAEEISLQSVTMSPSLANAIYLLRITMICCKQNRVEKAVILLYVDVVNDA